MPELRRLATAFGAPSRLHTVTSTAAGGSALVTPRATGVTKAHYNSAVKGRLFEHWLS